jgi:plasmid stability protein
MMKKVIDSLVDGAWLTQPPTFNGQLVRETTYFGDGSFGVVEYAFNGATSDMRITNLSFENRFTRDERKAIRRAALIDEDVQDFMSLAAKATHIDLSLRQTIDSVNALEQFGLIAEGRAAEILSPPVTDDERYEG